VSTNTIRFIRKQDLPPNCKPTYAKVVVADRPNKANEKRVRITVGGDRINYPDNVSTKVSDMSTVKININSTVSTEDALYGTGDIKDFFLNSIMDRPEYMKVPLSLFPKEIIDHYGLEDLADNGFIYVEINKQQGNVWTATGQYLG
jgi:hypothetical protein